MKKHLNIPVKHLASLLLLLTLVVLSLSACGSQEVMADPDSITTTEETTYTISTDSGTDTITDEISNEPTPLEETTEETSLEVSEPVVYEGIDMESDLPGIEWLDTLPGIIDEPKMVILNDSTNQKVIVENGATVKFAMDDLFVIYAPGQNTVTSGEYDLDTFNCSGLPEIYQEEYFINNPEYLVHINYNGCFLYGISGKYQIGDTVTTTNVITYNGKEIAFTANLILE